MTDEALGWRVEETCFNAFPSLRHALHRGWLLRFSEGLSRRGNSANPLPGCGDAAETIDAVEALYRGQGLPAIFRVPSFVAPAIDPPLAARGYRAEGDSCVLYGAIGDLAAAPDAAVRLFSEPSEAWLAAMAALQRHGEAQRSVYRRIVEAIVAPVAFAMLSEAGAPAALAYGALSDGMLCYESVVTAPERRRRGYARRVVAALADWARRQGAEAACLQVEAANAPARALYERFGLQREIYRYRYLRAPSPGH